MSAPKQLWKTTIVIWTEYDGSLVEITDLAREATSGEGFCSSSDSVLVTDKAQFPGTEFFDCPEDGEEETEEGRL